MTNSVILRQQEFLVEFYKIVARFIPGDMTLNPGDVIACGTSLGVKTMKPDTTVCVDIEGVGRLTNYYKPGQQ